MITVEWAHHMWVNTWWIDRSDLLYLHHWSAFWSSAVSPPSNAVTTRWNRTKRMKLGYCIDLCIRYKIPTSATISAEKFGSVSTKSAIINADDCDKIWYCRFRLSYLPTCPHPINKSPSHRWFASKLSAVMNLTWWTRKSLIKLMSWIDRLSSPP